MPERTQLFLKAIELYGYVATIISIILAIYFFYTIIAWILPVWVRLWLWLYKRKIAIFSETRSDTLEQMFIDSKIFKEKNIKKIKKDSIWSAEECNVFVVHWNDFKDKLDLILQLKKDSTPLIIYAPKSDWFVDNEKLDEIDTNYRNVVVANFKWRLINDVVSCMITTSYKIKF